LRRSGDNHDQIAGLDRSFRRNFRRRLGKILFDPLEVLEDFAPPLEMEQRLDGVALGARKLAHLRNANRDHRQVRFTASCCKFSGAKHSFTSTNAGSRKSGLSMP
jgi:hypothetical protein